MSFIGLESLLNGFESGFKLGEWCSKWEMLNKFLGFINGSNSFRMFTVFLLPNCILLISGCFFLGKGFFVTFDIFCGLSNICFCFFKCFAVIISHLGVCGNLIGVICDGVFKIDCNSITSSNVNSSNIIMFALIFEDSSNDFIKKHINFVSWTFSLHEYLNCWKDWVTKIIGINFS